MALNQYYFRLSLSVENEQIDAERDRLPNLSRETKFSGASGDREHIYFNCSADHEQDWQPYLVDPYSNITSDYQFTVFLIQNVWETERENIK